MTVFAQDSFTDTNATELSAHTGETGATWTKHPNYVSGFGSAEIQTNRLANSDAVTYVYYASGTPADADYDVEADLYHANSDSNALRAGPMGRVDTTDTDLYHVRWTELDGATNYPLQLYKWVGGSATKLGETVTTALSVGNSRTLKLEMRGTAIKAYEAGVEKISVTDASITAAGKAGVRAYVSSSDQSYQLDNFVATDTASAVSVTPGAGSVAATGYAPTAANNTAVAVTPDTATVAATGYAPTAANNTAVSVTPGVGAVAATGYAPSVTVDSSVNAEPGVATVTATGFAPSPSIAVSVTPGVASVAVTGYAVTAGNNTSVSVTPGLATVAGTGYAPTISAGAAISVTPGLATVGITGFAPDAQTAVWAAADAASTTWTPATPASTTWSN